MAGGDPGGGGLTPAEVTEMLAYARRHGDRAAGEKYGLTANAVKKRRERLKTAKPARTPASPTFAPPSGASAADLRRLATELRARSADAGSRVTALLDEGRETAAAAAVRIESDLAAQALGAERSAREAELHEKQTGAAEARLSDAQVFILQHLCRRFSEAISGGWSKAHEAFLDASLHALATAERQPNGMVRIEMPEPQRAALRRNVEATWREAIEAGTETDTESDTDLAARIMAEVEAESDPQSEVEGPNADATQPSKPDPHRFLAPADLSGGARQFAPVPPTDPAEVPHHSEPELADPLNPVIGQSRPRMREVRPGDRGSIRDRNPSFRRFDG